MHFRPAASRAGIRPRPAPVVHQQSRRQQSSQSVAGRADGHRRLCEHRRRPDDVCLMAHAVDHRRSG
ncbi:hypothetical protein SLNHY_0148 [Streptomyces albus]|nr:hypothetical protein SLNHY_0148 [Streptomyces albus]